MENIDTFVKEFSPIEIPTLGYIKIPKYSISDEDCKEYGAIKEMSSDDFLLHLARSNYKKKRAEGLIPADKEKIYGDRIKLELETYKKLFFADYILLIFSITQFCRKNNILNSPSRGSCGGSLVLYVIGVTSIDPISHDLLFERFVSASRTEIKEINGDIYLASSSLPDVDIDSDNLYKPLINKFLSERFENRTCRIVNLSTLQSKILIKECGKIVAAKTEQEMNHISDMILTIFGKPQSLETTYKDNADFKKWCDENREVYDIALQLQDLIKAKSVHASGIFISNEELKTCIPIELTKDKELVTSYDMSICELLGIKVDNLGLKNLGAIDHCLKAMGKTLRDINVNDPSIYNFLQNSRDYCGIFQCEEGLGKDTLIKIAPKNVEEIAVSLALGRPGCMKDIDTYVQNKESGNFSIGDPRIDDIVKITWGVIAYQEQIMQLCVRMASFTPQQADGVRKAVGKKKIEKVREFKPKFIDQSIANGYKKELVESIWQVFEDSGNYLFNRSHACGYSYLTAITAYLKANYPLQFYQALLIYAQYETKKHKEIGNIHKELARFGIKLLPPHMLKSEMDFTIEDGNIRFGLSAIKGVGEKTVENLKNFRNKYANKFEVFQAAKEAGLSIGVLSSLIQAGALEGFKQHRSKVVLEAQVWNKLTDKEKKFALSLAQQFDYDLFAIIKELKVKTNEKGKPIIPDKRYETIKKESQRYLQIYDQNRKNLKFANWYYERALLGYSYDTTLREVFSEQFAGLENVAEAKDSPHNTKVCFPAVVVETTQGVSKNAKKTKYFKLIVRDETEDVTVLVFNDKIELCKSINAGLPEEDNIVIIEGKKFNDAIFADRVIRQDHKIFMQLKDLKNHETEEKSIA